MGRSSASGSRRYGLANYSERLFCHRRNNLFYEVSHFRYLLVDGASRYATDTVQQQTSASQYS
jgi:hypothetical protein